MALVVTAAIFSLPSHVQSQDVTDNNISNPYPHASPVITKPNKLTQSDDTRTIKYYAELYKVDYLLAKSIAWCESRYDPSVDNAYSSASGLYQFLDGTWKHYGKLKWGSLEGKSVYNYGDNAELAVWVISKYGTHDWDASRVCWG